MLYALREGFSRLSRSWGLVFVVLATNLALAAILAVPFANLLEEDLENRDAAAGNLYGFDSAWWGAWHHRQGGFESDFGPEIFGTGFAFRNLDLLLKGHLPAGVFASGEGGAPGAETAAAAFPIVLGLGVLYLLVQTFLAGGLIGAFRDGRGGWTVRSLVHGSGFYFGRLFRVALVALFLAGIVFWLNAPFARWADARARESVSETTALVWAFGRHLLLALALLFVHLLSSYAKVIVVVEERASALLAWVSALGFCWRRAPAVLGHYLALILLGLVLLRVWAGLDGLWTTTGYKTQLGTFLLLQAWVVARIKLRLALLAGQTALFQQAAPPTSKVV